MAQRVKHLPAMWETRVRSLSQEDPLEKEMATHSSTLPGKSHGQRSMVGYSPWGCKVLFCLMLYWRHCRDQKYKVLFLRVAHNSGNQAKIPLSISESQKQDSNPEGQQFKDAYFILTRWLYDREKCPSYSLYPSWSTPLTSIEHSWPQINSLQKQIPIQREKKQHLEAKHTKDNICVLCHIMNIKNARLYKT